MESVVISLLVGFIIYLFMKVWGEETTENKDNETEEIVHTSNKPESKIKELVS